MLNGSFRRSLRSRIALLWTPSIRTAMNKTEHGIRLLDFVRRVFGKLEVVLESNIQIFFRGNLVEIHPTLPLSHLVNVFVILLGISLIKVKDWA